MKNSIRITLPAIVFILANISYSHSFVQKPVDAEKEIKVMNSKIEQLYLTENVNSLINLYARDLSFFVEYKPAMFEPEILKGFFTDWFNSVEIKTYKKKTFNLLSIGNHFLELGTFLMDYSSLSNPNGKYKGKYMILWERNEKGALTIVSETLSADSFIEPEAVPFAAAQVEDSDLELRQRKLPKHLLKEVQEFDAIVLRAVAEGDGDTRARGFAEDAILMAQYDSVRVGMQSIRPKMLYTYKPGSTYNVRHSYSKIVDLGKDFIFVTGHYKGGPTDPNNGGPFEGKMASLLKRDENGKLLMYRQTGNRDKRQN